MNEIKRDLQDILSQKLGKGKVIILMVLESGGNRHLESGRINQF